MAQPVATDRLDPNRLDTVDRRLIQAALVLTGDYNALLDGDWGPGSARALNAWLARNDRTPAVRTFADIVPLLDRFEADLSMAGWATINLDDPKISVALPLHLIQEDYGEEHLTFRDASHGLTFRVIIDLPRQTRAMHDWLAGAHAGPDEFYTSARNGRIITAARLANGKRVYLRSAYGAGLYYSMQVISEPAQFNRAALIASSMRWGAAPQLAFRSSSPLTQLIRSAASPAAVAQPAPPPAPPSTDQARGTGTGFYINNTDIVTADHVVSDCRRVSLEDGTTLRVLATNPMLDVALLSSGQRSANWLSISDAAEPKLGEDIFALGYPYLGLFDQGLSVTGGNVSALPRQEGPEARVMISAPVQPGNSGGPLLNENGEVLGVVVSRADDLAVLDASGSLPQNMNFAVPTAALVAFLRQQNVLFPSSGAGSTDLSDGIPESVQNAVVTVYCH